MSKRPSKHAPESHLPTQPDDMQPLCPHCGVVVSEKSPLALMDQLVRSHTELCSTLRLVGRQLLRFEHQGDESLEKVREILKRGDNIRKALQSSDGLPEALEHPSR